MFLRLIALACLVSLLPSLAGAGEIAALAPPQHVQQAAAPPAGAPVNLMPSQEGQARLVVAANDLQGAPAGEERQAKKTHRGLTMQEFVDVHFGENRWIYWAIAGVALVALHVAVAD